MPINHKKRWSLDDIKKITTIAETLNSKNEMYKISSALSMQFGRTEGAVCKKIEEIRGWFWAK